MRTGRCVVPLEDFTDEGGRVEHEGEPACKEMEVSKRGLLP